MAALWFCTGIGLGEYASPFAVALAGTCFLIFARVPWPRRLAVWGTRGLWSPLLARLDALWLRVFPER